MLQGLFTFIGTIFGWLNDLLPDSPFTGLVQASQDLSLGISWLNWLFPINEMLAILAIWIAACAAITAVRVALDLTGSVAGKVVGK